MGREYAGGRVLQAVRDAGPHGATIAELVEKLGLHAKTVAGHLRDHAKKGHIDCHELETKVRGGREKVWYDPKRLK